MGHSVTALPLVLSPAVFVLDLRLIALSFHKGTFGALLKVFLFHFFTFYFLKTT
jgi:hypothetical protein